MNYIFLFLCITIWAICVCENDTEPPCSGASPFTRQTSDQLSCLSEELRIQHRHCTAAGCLANMNLRGHLVELASL